MDFRAFAGVASAIKSMVEGIRLTDPSFALEYPTERSMSYNTGDMGVGGIPGAIVRYLRRRYHYLELSELFDKSNSYFDFNHDTWDSSQLEAHIYRNNLGNMLKQNGEALILSDRRPEDVLLPLLRSGSTVRYQDVGLFIKHLLLSRMDDILQFVFLVCGSNKACCWLNEPRELS